MEVEETLQELVQDGFDGPGGNGLALRLVVVVNDLEQVVFGIFEDYEDALVFQDDFIGMYDVEVCKLGAKSHLAYS
jgi:hypothetical protein